uniref:RP9 pre-mRNA splicing factor n=1 Tax=Oncorhynchus mykiss TaxID=8022 RepID=A0A8C7VI42_ONCMY
MSSRKRSLYSDDRGDRKRHNESKHDVEKLKEQATKTEPRSAKAEEDYKPEDCIPADPGNEDARDFLAQAPTKGLWMPQGKGVKVMQCELEMQRYGHRTGDRECPFFIKGNQNLEQFRVAHEDPMYDMIRENKQNEKETTFWFYYQHSVWIDVSSAVWIDVSSAVWIDVSSAVWIDVSSAVWIDVSSAV